MQAFMSVAEIQAKRELTTDPALRALWEIAANLALMREGAALLPPCCPVCGAFKSEVVDTRNGSRRRKCAKCGGTFDTVTEAVERVQSKEPTAYQLAKAEAERTRYEAQKGKVKK